MNFRDWLGSTPADIRGEPDESGRERFTRKNEDGGRKKINEETMAELERAHSDLSQPDEYGNLRFGTETAGVNPQGYSRAFAGTTHEDKPVDIDGQKYVRSDYKLSDMAKVHPIFSDFVNSIPENERGFHNPQYGYVIPEKYGPGLQDARTKYGALSEDFVTKMGPLAPAAVGAMFMGPALAGGGGLVSNAGGAMDMGVGLSSSANAPVWGFTGGEGLSAFGTEAAAGSAFSNLGTKALELAKKNPLSTLSLLRNFMGGQQTGQVVENNPVVQGDLSGIQLKSSGLIGRV